MRDLRSTKGGGGDGLDGPNKGSFNERSLQTITHKSAHYLPRSQPSKTFDLTRSAPIPSLLPSVRFLHIAAILLFFPRRRWGSAIGGRGERKWVYGAAAQIRLGAAINMIIPLEGMKEGRQHTFGNIGKHTGLWQKK